MLTREFFSKTDIGKKLSDHCFEAVFSLLAANAYERHFNAGEIITPIGSIFGDIMLIKKGIVKSYCYTSHGERIFFYYFPVNTTIGLVATITRDISRSENIADKDCTIVYIPQDDFMNTLSLIPSFEHTILKLIAENANRQIEISILSRCKYARDRLCLYLFFQYSSLRSTTIPIHFTIEALANYLGLTRSVLSKELHALEDEKIICLSKKEILITDIEKLKTYI